MNMYVESPNKKINAGSIMVIRMIIFLIFLKLIDFVVAADASKMLRYITKVLLEP